MHARVLEAAATARARAVALRGSRRLACPSFFLPLSRCDVHCAPAEAAARLSTRGTNRVQSYMSFYANGNYDSMCICMLCQSLLAPPAIKSAGWAARVCNVTVCRKLATRVVGCTALNIQPPFTLWSVTLREHESVRAWWGLFRLQAALAPPRPPPSPLVNCRRDQRVASPPSLQARHTRARQSGM